MRSILLSLAAAASIAGFGCAPSTTTTVPPTHGSITEERAAAHADERAAAVLERQAAIESGDDVRCGPTFDRESGSICWTSPRPSGASARDNERAERLREAAAQHRRVSGALRQAEARACAGVPEADIVESPFAHREDVVAVDVIRGPGPEGHPRVLGARVRFHHIEHLTADWLQHVVDCHIARDDAMGHDVPEMTYCPLVPRGARATVTDVPHGYVIEVLSDDPDGAREIARRAMALLQ